MSEIRELIEALVAFRDARDWQQFHDSKNLAVALSIEAAELNEVFLWKDVNASEEVDKAKIKEESSKSLRNWFKNSLKRYKIQDKSASERKGHFRLMFILPIDICRNPNIWY